MVWRLKAARRLKIDLPSFGAPARAQRSGSRGERRSKGAGAVFAVQAETELSGLCDDEARLSAISARSEMAISVPRKINGTAAAIYGGPIYKPPSRPQAAKNS